VDHIIRVPDALRDHRRRASDEARQQFKHAIRPIFSRTSDGRPDLVGSSVLLEVDGVHCLATAAHVLGSGVSLHLGAMTDIIPLNAVFGASVFGAEGRPGGPVDIAVAVLSAEQLIALEGRTFISVGEQMQDFVGGPTRGYLVSGYRASQNKVPVRGVKLMTPTLWSFTGVAGTVPTSKERPTGPGWNFGIDYPKSARRMDGSTVTTTPPHGISGGAVFDLGDFANADQVFAGPPAPPRLAGILIECPRKGRVLIATQIVALRAALERAQSGTP
jgi:hypothetical protein